MKNIFALLLLTVLISSCGNKEPFDADTERLKIIDARENSMPIVSEMLDLRREIVTKAGNVNLLKESDQEMINEWGEKMRSANSDLMQWMNNFNRNIEEYMDMENGAPEQRDWMEDMSEELEDIIDEIQDVIKDGKKVLEKL